MNDRNNKQMLVTASVLILLNILIIKIFGLDNFSFERVNPVFAYIFHFICHSSYHHLLRFKIQKKQGILKGIFLYQFIGALASLYFCFSTMGIEVGFKNNI